MFLVWLMEYLTSLTYLDLLFFHELHQVTETLTMLFYPPSNIIY